MGSFPFAPHTQRSLAAYLAAPTQGVLLTGEPGVGVDEVLQFLVAKLGRDAAHRVIIAPEDGSISIERMRRLYAETRSARKSRLVVAIKDADGMSHDAQNSFLKLLEEPPRYVHFIIATHHKEALLPTILSRVNQVTVGRITESQSNELVGSLMPSDTQRQQRSLFLAHGRPGELKRLCTDDAYYAQQVAVIEQARAWIQGDAFQRLTIVGAQSKDRDQLEWFVSVIGELVRYGVERSGVTAATVAMLGGIDTCLDVIAKNGNIKLAILGLVWNSNPPVVK